MLPDKYLLGMNAMPFAGLEGVFAVVDYRSRASSRFVACYVDGKRNKEEIFAVLEKLGQKEAPGEWELHHVVERQHFADVDFSGRLEFAYENELPCVLIHRNEHVAYNQLLHVKATDELFREALPRVLLQRSRAAVADARDRRKHRLLQARVDHLRTLYRHLYQGDAPLQRIADNVFLDALAQLR